MDIQAEALQEEKEALELMKSGRLELAKYRFAKLCKRYPQHAKFHFNNALVLYKLKQYTDSLEEINKGLFLKPEDEKATRFKREISALVSKSMLDEGEKTVLLKETPMDLESQIKSIETGEQASLVEHVINLLILQIKEIGKKAEDDANTIEDPRIKEFLIEIKRIAQVLYEKAQYKQSLLIYSTFSDYFPEDLEALFNIGFCEREIGNFRESEKVFKRIIELFYDNAYAWHNLALIYAITNEGDKEVYCLQKAREFGYLVDIQPLSRLEGSLTPHNPFDSD